MVTNVKLALLNCILATFTFDLWMSKGVHDIFTIVINFRSNDWETKHVTNGLFELTYTNGATMALKLQKFLDMFSLIEKLLLM
jgi:hypothetical protein